MDNNMKQNKYQIANRFKCNLLNKTKNKLKLV